MYPPKSNKTDDIITGFSFIGIALFLMLLVFSYFNRDVLYQDYYGHPAVCDIKGTYYDVHHPECQKAIKETRMAASMTIWQGSCNKYGICTPQN